MVRKRLFQVLRSGLFLLLIGGIYSIFLQKTGIGFVCPVNFLTGLKCPGCGVSHMCIALMQLDFAAAFMANPAILLLSPVLATVLLQYLMHYIKTGRWQIRPAQNVILWICIMILIFYGIGRNLFPRLCTIE